jgi:transposase-like protein
MKEDVDRLLQSEGRDEALPPMDGFVCATAQFMLQLAIEAEATAFLGWDHYRRGARQRLGWRNGYEPKAVQTEAGLVKLAVPQLRATEERFRPILPDRWGRGVSTSRGWSGACMCAASPPGT